MVNIREMQYQKENKANMQSRIITYESWEKYVNDLRTVDGFKENLYPSLPRMTKLENVELKDNEVIGEFFNRAMKMNFIHVAYAI